MVEVVLFITLLLCLLIPFQTWSMVSGEIRMCMYECVCVCVHVCAFSLSQFQLLELCYAHCTLAHKSLLWNSKMGKAQKTSRVQLLLSRSLSLIIIVCILWLFIKGCYVTTSPFTVSITQLLSCVCLCAYVHLCLSLYLCVF